MLWFVYYKTTHSLCFSSFNCNVVVCFDSQVFSMAEDHHVIISEGRHGLHACVSITSTLQDSMPLTQVDMVYMPV